VALKVLELMRHEAPALFSDYELVALPDGSPVVRSLHPKV